MFVLTFEHADISRFQHHVVSFVMLVAWSDMVEKGGRCFVERKKMKQEGGLGMTWAS